MTIQEAIESKKLFKRPNWTHWAEVGLTIAGFQVVHRADNTVVNFQMQDLVANDWETADQVVGITRGQFELAWRKCSVSEFALLDDKRVFKSLCLELGLGK